jgi:cytochrome oxidase Cu insertion factor (SCO1/SenC/PrrC family)
LNALRENADQLRKSYVGDLMRFTVLLLTFALALAACAPAASPTARPQAAMVETALEATAQPPTPTTATVGETTAQPTTAPTSVAATSPAWQSLPLVNARTGETFSLADFAGKTVFVEPMATWCTNCKQQLGNVRAAREQLNSANVVFVALSVETDLEAAALAEYADGNGFDWVFAVVTPELLGELAATFGRTITNPPSTPHFIIRPDGTTTPLVTGIESADQIVSQLQAEGGA